MLQYCKHQGVHQRDTFQGLGLINLRVKLLPPVLHDGSGLSQLTGGLLGLEEEGLVVQMVGVNQTLHARMDKAHCPLQIPYARQQGLQSYTVCCHNALSLESQQNSCIVYRSLVSSVIGLLALNVAGTCTLMGEISLMLGFTNYVA